MVTMRQLRYFVATAEELSFVRAAAKLHVSQPPLSSQIKALEDELGIQLLHRDTRTVRLTEAGRAFLEGSQRVLDDLQRTIQETGRTAAGEVGTLRIGAVGTSVFCVLPQISERLAEVLPDVEIAVVQQGSREQHHGLLRGDLDVALFHAPFDDDALEVNTIYRDSFSVILPLDHPLATAQPFSLSLLSGESFVNYPRTSAPVLFDLAIGACMLAGFSPRIKHTGDFLAMVQMVAMGLGVALVPSSLAKRSQGIVAVRTIDDAPLGIGIDLGWKRDGPSPLVRRAVDAIMEAFPPLAA